MRRVRAALLPLALIATTALAIAPFLVGESSAELENQVFTSRADRLRVLIPRGWRVTEQSSYPGFLLWLMRSRPEGRIVLTAETFTRELYCSWPVACRQSRDPLVSRYACALRDKLAAQKLRVEAVQAGPKENTENKFPSVWFDFDDGKHYLRQAIAFSTDNRIVSFVLSSPSDEARDGNARSFEQMLRTLHSIDDGAAATYDGGTRLVSDGGISPDGGGDAGTMFESAPAPKQNPIGPCTN
ncbi:MAG: hypothetical protein H0T79_04340 [Deltaproteobacteria bacterium]|nr:hypothetical protein [Deltaproteobacteria bacterium]